MYLINTWVNYTQLVPSAYHIREHKIGDYNKDCKFIFKRNIESLRGPGEEDLLGEDVLIPHHG